METTNGKKTGRPSIYSKELATEICTRLANGESLRSICRDEKMPAISTVMSWLFDDDKKDFVEQYERARDIQADVWADEITDIADNGENDYMEREREDGSTYPVVNTENIQRSRLRVDARKWVASKLKPKKYGDKIDVTSDNKPIQGNAISFVSFGSKKG